MDDRDYRERLAHDVARWRHEGLISPEQELAILARQGAGEPRLVRALRLGWLVTSASIIGAIVLAAGVVLLFASNWEAMPDWFRASLVFAGIAVAYAIGYALIYRYDMQRIGSALLLLGVLLYHAGLFLLAQIYNMPVDSPFLLFLAAAGTLPLAYLFGSRIILLVAIADLTGWAWWELATRYEDFPELLAALLIIAVLGVAWYAVGRLHGTRPSLQRFEDVWAMPGLLVMMALVYIFTFSEPWRSMVDEGVESFAAPVLVYVAIGAAALLVGSQVLFRTRTVEDMLDLGAQALLLGLALVVATWPAWTGYSLIFNVVYFAVAGGLTARGYLAGDERYINAGLVLIALGVLTRYIDIFWSLLAGSAFFIIGGVLLLAVAFAVERFRRGLLARMTDGDAGGDRADEINAGRRASTGEATS